VWKRAAVVAAGPIANFILAIAIFAGINYVSGRQVLAPRIESIQPGSAAERAGLLPNDVIVSINGRTIESFADMQRWVSANAGETLTIVVDRNGERVPVEAIPDLKEQTTPFGKQRIGLLGVQASRNPEDIRRITYGPVGAVTTGAKETWYVIDRTFDYIGKLVTGRESTDQLSGPSESRRSPAGGQSGWRRRPHQPHRRALGLDRPHQPLPGPAPRWRPPGLLWNRGRPRPPVERPSPGDRLPDRLCARLDAHALRDLE
jgi:membrane-associated protease RseP (regulator of RpoE activity)